jgi:hypothetical protein
LLLAAVALLAVMEYRIVAVTDQRIFVCEANVWNPRIARRYIGEIDRTSRLRTGSGRKRIEIGGPNLPTQRLYVRGMRVKLAAAADRHRFDHEAIA